MNAPAPTAPVEYEAAAALFTVLRFLPDPGGPDWPKEIPPIMSTDRVANVVAFTVAGVAFHAVITQP